VQLIGDRSVPGRPRSPHQRNASVKRIYLSSSSFSSCTLIALLGFNCIAAGQTAPRATDLPAAAGTSARAAAVAKSVTIDRDTFGVPHVYGPTDAACVFGFMYAQAEDYFWQVEDSYLRSIGRAAEIYGEQALPDDLVNRALEITRLSKEDFQTASPKNKEICQATADGLNYYLAANPQTKPRLIAHFEPWHPLAFRRFILYQSFIYGKSGLQASDILSAVQEIRDDKVGAIAFPADLRAKLVAIEQDRQGMSEHVGSNMWAVRPQKSASGMALMFINPHQPFFGPGQWYEGHLKSGEGWDLLGACFFGSPFPTLGYNGHIAWSHTVNNPDIVDLYTVTFDDNTDPLKYRHGSGLKQAVAWTDEVKVKGATGSKTRRFRFTKTHQGPLVAVRDGKPLAIRLAKLEDNGAIDQGHAMGRAKSVAEFKEAMRPCNLPMFNAIVADSLGNIFYVYNGAVPRRSANFDWTKPVDGSNPETDWQGYLRFDELPQLENPKCGFLQNCNQSPLSTTPLARELQAGEVDENPRADQFPPYVMATERERDNPRSQISRRILHSTDKFAYDDWTRDGFDTKILEAELRIPDLVKEWDAMASKEPDRAAKVKEPVDLLKNWNCESSVDSVAMTLFTEVYDRVLKMAAKRDLLNFPRVRALEASVADLEKSRGTWKVAWGEINRLQRVHGSQINLQGRGEFRDDQPSLPIAGAPGPLGVVFNFYTVPQPGQKRRYGVAGHSFVAAVELAAQPLAKTILQFGESGDPASPHWFDQAALYAKKQFKPSWYTQADVAAHSERRYHPGEESTDRRPRDR
jgi:acyl-homoserine-lactone acylase